MAFVTPTEVYLEGGGNPHEDAARWRKVAHLLAALYRHEIPTHRAARFGHHQWATIAAIARVKPPSITTVRLLRETLQDVRPPPQTPATPKDE